MSLRSLAITARYLSRDECEAITKRALSFATADETRVVVNSINISNTRFAVNQISTGGDSFDSVVNVNPAHPVILLGDLFENSAAGFHEIVFPDMRIDVIGELLGDLAHPGMDRFTFGGI